MRFNINSVLTIWGSMARERGCKGYPTMESFMREAPKQVYRVMQLDDETYFLIDRLFLQLYELEPLQYKIIRDRYIKQMENREICRQLHIGKGQFDLALACAKAFISGALVAKEIKVWV